MYATVEGVAMGKATVRLATNGARLTNCPILGAEVSIGERVVVDYSAEGQPVVRPYTIPGTELIEETEDEPEAEEQDSEFVYCKYTVSDAEINNPTVKANIGYSPWYLEPGFICGSWLGAYRYKTNFDNVVPWDEAIYESTEILDRNYAGVLDTYNPGKKGFIRLPKGSYFINVTVGIEIGTNDISIVGGAANLAIQSGWSIIPDAGYTGFKRVYKREHHAIVQQSWFGKSNGIHSSANGFRVMATLDGAGNNIYDPAQYLIPDAEKLTVLKYAKKQNAYPVLEIYKVADIGPHKTHMPEWSYNEYDYPGQ